MLNAEQVAKLQSSSAKKEDMEEKLSYVLLVVARCCYELPALSCSHFGIYYRSTDGSISDINFLHDSLRKYNASETEEV